jgi:hypothetical protein
MRLTRERLSQEAAAALSSALASRHARTDDEVNADLLAFIKEAIIAIRGRLQAWSTRGERHD